MKFPSSNTYASFNSSHLFRRKSQARYLPITSPPMPPITLNSDKSNIIACVTTDFVAVLVSDPGLWIYGHVEVP